MTPDEFMIRWQFDCEDIDTELNDDLQAVVNDAIAKERAACVEAINRTAFDIDLTGFDGKYAGYSRGIRDAIGAIRARDTHDAPEKK